MADTDASHNTGLISFSMYVYVKDLAAKQYLYCKNRFQGWNVYRAWCMGIDSTGMIFIEANTDNTLSGNTMETLTTALTFQKGWNLVGCYYDPDNTNHADIVIPTVPLDPLDPLSPLIPVPRPDNLCWNLMPDGTYSETVGNIDHTTGIFTDMDDLYTCVGTRKTNRNNAADTFVGMIHSVTSYSDPLVLTDLQAMVSYTCDSPCPICLTVMNPTCLEYIDNAYISKWDFTSPIYQTTSTDNGANGYDFSLIDDQTSYDPIYVDNQGLYFDGTSHIRTSTAWTQNNLESFTYEGWIRPTTATLQGQLLTFEKDPNDPEAYIAFNGNNLEIDVDGTTVTIPVTYTDVGEWHYVGISFRKYENNRLTI